MESVPQPTGADPTLLNNETLNRHINSLARMINDLELQLELCCREQERRESNQLEL